jgi:7-carboxy-7-deazaguanine synthase
VKTVEIFHSVQGEGVNIGKPAVFIRLAGCNLSCSWCDSKYASQPTQTFDLTVDSLLNVVAQYNSCKHIVWTGGEPLLQALDISKVAKELKKAGYYQELETNGTLNPFPLNTIINQWNVSPKLGGQGQEPGVRINIESLSVWATLMSNVWWKFVISSPEDISETILIIDKLQIERDRVFLMPQMIEHDQKSHAVMCLLVDVAKKHGFRFSPRLHILLWGHRRGV